MTPIDPDDTPTRPGGRARPVAGDHAEDATVPAYGRAAPSGLPPAGGGPAARPPAGAGAAAAGDGLVGVEIGGCRIERLLGRGAMGAVYKARQVKLDRDVAVKVIRPEMMTDPRMLKRFEVEARTVGKFNSAHVVMVHDVGFEHGVHYLVMEFVQGKNLRDHVKLLAGGRLPAGDALPLLRQAIKGLEEAQRLQVVHRDIKPDNLMLTDRGMLKIADFGIAKPLQEDFSMTLTAELVGTPLYMSPEQCQGETELDFRSDMYSLGATFYYLLTGEPPIRASSVYELIQTKTRLESLCLWKALPGLEENNPLSRVIERMTALDRDDRYGSYEELLNDLVLVEHGQSIPALLRGAGAGKARSTKAGSTKPGRAPVRAGRGRVLWTAVLLLAATGGGYVLYTSQAGAVQAAPGGANRGADRGADPGAAAALRALAARLAEDGPSERLRGELAALVVAGGDVDERDRWLVAADAGLALAARLEALAPPAELPLPFDGLRAHFAAVDAAAAVELPPELSPWRQRVVAAARREAELAARATAALTSALVQWRGDRDRAGGDAATLAALATRLDMLERGRRALLDLVPAGREELERVLPAAELDAARRALREPAPRAAEVDVAAVLRDVRTEFRRDGPTEALRDRVGRLQPTQPGQLDERNGLLNEIDAARSVREQVTLTRTSRYPEAPQPPFDDVVDYFQTIERALQPLRAGGAALPQWAAALREQCRAEGRLRPVVLAACTRLFQRWQQRRAGGAPAAELAAELQALRAARARAAELFPQAADELELALPAAELSAATGELQQLERRQAWLADAGRLLARLGAVQGLSDWQAAATTIQAEADELRAAAAPFGADAELAAALRRADEALARWRAAAVRVAEAGKHLGDGDLTAASRLAREGVPGDEGRGELQVVGEVAAACRELFAGLEQRLDVAEARTALGAARTRLQALAPLLPRAVERLAGWGAALDQLERVASGMVVIPGGRAKNGGSAAVAFFLAPTECSREEFARFVAELRQTVAGAADPAARWQRVAGRLAGTGLDADRLQALLDRDVRADKLPIDNVTWYAAAACARWQGRALPTAAEWSLAAFGEGGRFEFPWGNGWSNDAERRNPSNQALAEVDAGGLSWRSADGVRVHHLAGNVAEWLAADEAARTAPVAGGRYNDNSDTSVREQAAGRLLEADKADARRGFGFRTVLRPRGFPGLDWPR